MKNRLSIYTLWNIGKATYYNRDNCSNIFKKNADYYSYFYGNSYLFTRENIHYMMSLYLNFPMYYPKLEIFNWQQYKLLLSIPNKKERFFYFSVFLLMNANYYEMCDLISNDYYNRI